MSQRPTIYGMSLLVRLTLLYGLFLTIHNSHTKAQKYAENSYTCLNFLIGLYNYVTLGNSLRATWLASDHIHTIIGSIWYYDF